MANISPEALSLIDSFSGQIVSLFKDVKDEINHFINDGLLEYENNQYNKYIKTKTFLFRNESIDFYDTYFPLNLRNGKGKFNIEEQGLLNLFDNSNYISFVGNAGSGKTMLMKYIYLEFIKHRYKIPIVIELRNLNNFKGNIQEYIYSVIFDNKLSPNKKILERLLDSGNFIFLLDGYDEIFSENKEKITIDIDSFIDKFNKNYYLITSRPGANVESIPRFECYNVCPLNPLQIYQFLEKQIKGIEQEEDFLERITKAIKNAESRMYRAYLSSPLLLSMFILTFDSYPELPKTKSKFYWNVFDTLCTKHDSLTKKGGFLHERKTKLSNEEFEIILKWFSYTSLFDGKFGFDSEYIQNKLKLIKKELQLSFNIESVIYDLTVSIGIIIIDGLEYKFPHKSLQEYFSALLIKEQSEENKKKIYEEKFKRVNQKMLGGDLNLWQICNEIDKISFCKYYLLPELLKITDDLKIPNKRLEVFISSTQFSLGIYIKEISITRMMSVSSPIINLLYFFDLPSIFSRIKKIEFDKYIMEAFLKKHYKNDFLKTEMNKVRYIYFTEIDDKILELCTIIDFNKIIDGIVKNFEDKISEITEYINNNNKLTYSLLDI